MLHLFALLLCLLFSLLMRSVVWLFRVCGIRLAVVHLFIPASVILLKQCLVSLRFVSPSSPYRVFSCAWFYLSSLWPPLSPSPVIPEQRLVALVVVWQDHRTYAALGALRHQMHFFLMEIACYERNGFDDWGFIHGALLLLFRLAW